MRKSFFILVSLLTLAIAACSLNAHQEESLNRSVTRFLEAQRKGVTLAYVSMIHPDFVRHYKQLGDSLFVQNFKVNEKDDFEHFVDDYTIQKTVKKNQSIHVAIHSRPIAAYSSPSEKKERKFMAISSDNGETWVFVNGKDYFDKSIVPTFERLIEDK